MTDLRLATEYVEVLADLPVPTLRVGTEYVEVLTDLPTPNLNTALLYVEVLTNFTPPAPVIKYRRVGRAGSVRASTW